MKIFWKRAGIACDKTLTHSWIWVLIPKAKVKRTRIFQWFHYRFSWPYPFKFCNGCLPKNYTLSHLFSWRCLIKINFWISDRSYFIRLNVNIFLTSSFPFFPDNEFLEMNGFIHVIIIKTTWSPKKSGWSCQWYKCTTELKL